MFNTGIHATFHFNDTLTPRPIYKTFAKYSVKRELILFYKCRNIYNGYHSNLFFTALHFFIIVISFGTSNCNRS